MMKNLDFPLLCKSRTRTREKLFLFTVQSWLGGLLHISMNKINVYHSYTIATEYNFYHHIIIKYYLCIRGKKIHSQSEFLYAPYIGSVSQISYSVHLIYVTIQKYKWSMYYTPILFCIVQISLPE